MTKPEEYATPGATWAAIRAAARKESRRLAIPTNDLVQLLLFDRFLARVFRGSDSPFVLKGGTRMLAYLPSARATLDVDLETSTYSSGAAVEELERLVDIDVGDRLRFTLSKQDRRLGGENQPNVALTTLTFQADGTGQRVKVDLAVHDRAGAATVRAAPAFRVPLGRDVPTADYVMVAVEQQIADKVAAMMERRYGDGSGRSSRAKDLVDLALIALNLGCDAALLKTALDLQVHDRGLESFVAVDTPPLIQLAYATVARKAPGAPSSWQEAEELTNGLVGPVLDGKVRVGSWRPVAGEWEAVT